jgi:hypothetical protein
MEEVDEQEVHSPFIKSIHRISYRKVKLVGNLITQSQNAKELIR